jgi:hypothetical protein
MKVDVVACVTAAGSPIGATLSQRQHGLISFASIAAESSLYGKVLPGDELLLIDGRPVKDAEEASSVLRSAGGVLNLAVLRQHSPRRNGLVLACMLLALACTTAGWVWLDQTHSRTVVELHAQLYASRSANACITAAQATERAVQERARSSRARLERRLQAAVDGLAAARSRERLLSSRLRRCVSPATEVVRVVDGG